jgi:hypothetical protein
MNRSFLFTGIVFLCVSAASARADYVFNFNSLAAFTGTTGNNSSAIAAYMDSIFGCANCVTVTGAVTDRTYNGENHVVGPNGHSITLGNTDGATSNSDNSNPTTNDTFLSNLTDKSRSVSSEIVIKLTGIVLNGPISFDYEIFPDATCQSKTNCSAGLPDFTFAVNGGTKVFTTYGAFPADKTDGTSTHSPNSGSTHTENSAQYIGTYSGTLTNVTELDFIDWPAAIAIDNLVLSHAPEPRGVGFVMGGLLLAVMAVTKRRQARAKA